MAKRKKHPVPKEDFTNEIIKSKKLGQLTEKAGKYILILVTNYQNNPKLFRYDNDDIKNDVKSVAIEIICEKWYRFNPNTSNNAFSYFTQMAHHGLCEGMNIYKKNKERNPYRYDQIFDESI